MIATFDLKWCLILLTLMIPLSNLKPAHAQDSNATSVGGRRSKAASTFGPALRGQKVIDLSHTFDEKTIYWPTEDGFRLIPDKAGFTDKGYYYSSNRFTAAEHGGTHLDAPIHFYQRGKTAEELTLSQLIGEAAVIDVAEACQNDPDYQIGVADLRRWEESQGRQLIDVIVLLRTGYAKHWPDRMKYLGTDELGPDAVAKLHFPGLSPEAAQWLCEHRAIKAIGLDTASIDYGQSERFQSHVMLYKHGIPALENVADMSELPASGSTVIALPMKIGGGSGAPARIIAVLPER
jgi:kynurenine formamidase